MVLNNNDTCLGVYMTGDKLRVVESEVIDNDIQIINVAEVKLEVPFDFYVIGNEDFISKFSDAINNVIETRGIKANNAAFALERRMVLLKKILVDRNFGDEELRQHIEWETEQFIVTARSEFNIAFEKLGFYDNDLEEVILIAARKAIVLYLKEIFLRTSLNLKILDVDLFADIRAIADFQNYSSSHWSALVDYGNRGADISILRDNKYYSSIEVHPKKDNSNIIQLSEIPDAEMANLVNKELNNLLSASKSNVSIDDLSCIYLLGDHITDDFITELEKIQTVKVQVADPFKNLNVSLDSASEMEIRNHPERFITGVGLALRKN